MILEFTGLVLLSLVITLLSLKQKPEWYESEVTSKFSWKKLTLLSGAYGVLLGSVSLLLWGNIFVAQSIFLVGWLLPIVCVTDFRAYKIPKGVSVITYYAALTLMLVASVYSQSWLPLISTGIAFIVPSILAFVRGIGFGDVRLIMLFSFALPWWMGLYNWTMGLLLGAAIQLVVFLVSYATKSGKKIKTSDNGKEKKVLPFGPALLVGYTVMAFYVQNPAICEDLLCGNVPIF